MKVTFSEVEDDFDHERVCEVFVDGRCVGHLFCEPDDQQRAPNRWTPWTASECLSSSMETIADEEWSMLSQAKSAITAAATDRRNRTARQAGLAG